jgi:hypothetical protein
MDITINEIGIVMVIIGLPLLLLSNVMYYKRTQDKGIMSRFWLSRNILSRNEYILNRIGFFLVLIALLIKFFI